MNRKDMMKLKPIIILFLIISLIVAFVIYWLSPTQQIRRNILSEINSICNLNFKERLIVFQKINIEENAHGEMIIENKNISECSTMEFMNCSVSGIEKYFDNVGKEKSVLYIKIFRHV